MSKKAAIKIEHLADITLDKPGVFLRAEHRFWADGSSCLNIMKWATRPTTGRVAPWWRPQYVQVRWEQAPAALQWWYEVVANQCAGAVDWPLGPITLDSGDQVELLLRASWSDTGDFGQLEKRTRHQGGVDEIYKPRQRLVLSEPMALEIVEALLDAVARQRGKGQPRKRNHRPAIAPLASGVFSGGGG